MVERYRRKLSKPRRKRGPARAPFYYPSRRHFLMPELIREIEEGGNGITSLYARLLAAALLETDEALMQQFGARIAALSSEAVCSE